MKKLNKNLIVVLIAVFMFGSIGPINVYAVTATAPVLGTAASFSVLGGVAMTADASGATISGDLGVNPGLAVTGTWTHTGGANYFGASGLSGTANADATAAWTSMGSSGGTAWNPAVVNPTLTAGLYTRDGDATFGSTLTLNGSATDVWIFQINSSLTFTDEATIVLTGGAQACNVFWRVASSATINGASGKTFVGTLIANSSVSLIGGATVNGRMMALTGTLSTAGITRITGPTCTTIVPPVSGGSRPITGTITVVKNVINDNGGTKTATDFKLYVNGTSNPVASGITNVFPATPAVNDTYIVTETNDPKYSRVFSGDCDINGQIILHQDENKICIITNNDIGAPVVPPVPPIIAVVKVPNPLALPGGPGLVEYTYTLRNIGTVPVTNITMVGDTCSPIVLISGDTNGDSKLDLNETWVHTCSTLLTETHTNTVVATGWANGLSATDIASATVIVGASIVPPLIHVTKVPSPLTLPAGGGMVTYTKKVTNPGTVALSNVVVTDDKCGPVNYISGDTNNNAKLDTTETWTYTCKENLTKTTTNTVTASGQANGLTARDFAIANVIVASPKLPNTGFAPGEKNSPWNIIVLAGVVMLVSASYVAMKKRTINN